MAADGGIDCSARSSSFEGPRKRFLDLPGTARRPLGGSLIFWEHEPRADLIIVQDSEYLVNSYPVSEQRISEVERGQSCNATLPIPPGKRPSAGEFVLFALAHMQAGGEPHYVKDGDSVCVLLTDVTDLGTTDPATGQALFRLSWKPLGQNGSPETVAKRIVKSSHPRTKRL
jgi:hypothetical protein